MSDGRPRPLLRSTLRRAAGRRADPAPSGPVAPPTPPEDPLFAAEPYVARWVPLPEPPPRTAAERMARALRPYAFPLAAAAAVAAAGLLIWLAPTSPTPGEPVPLPPELRGLPFARETPGARTPLRALTVETFPGGAAVSVDGLPLGRTPLRTPTLTADVEAITFHVEKEGYRPLDTLASVVAGVERLRFTLVPLGEGEGRQPFVAEAAPSPAGRPSRGAALPVATAPARTASPAASPAGRSAVASVDARAYGTVEVLVRMAGPGGTRRRAERVFSGELPVGRQRVRLSHPALGTWEQDVVVRAGKGQRVYVPAPVAEIEAGGPSRAAPPPAGPPPSFVNVQRQPVPVKQVQPEYPDGARRAGIEGNVLVKVRVGRDGRVRDAQVQRSDNDLFDAPALAAVRQWTFEPAIQAGNPVDTWVSVPIYFRTRQ